MNYHQDESNNDVNVPIIDQLSVIIKNERICAVANTVVISPVLQHKFTQRSYIARSDYPALRNTIHDLGLPRK